jgi:catechol 2,3-dioxygenase-like lactoylglutathione lyase family enzyme
MEDPMHRIRRISHAAFTTPNLAAQTEYYEQVLGLTVTAREKDAIYLASSLDHHSIVLKTGDAAACTNLAFQVGAGELADLRKQVEGHGIAVTAQTDAQPGIAAQITFADTKGTKLEVFEAPAPAPQPYSGRGVNPLKLGHVAFNTDDIQRDVGFYTKVLGFRESDWMGDFFAFLRCSPDHHTLNFVNSGKIKMHHCAFELRDWNHIQAASDYLASRKIPLIWGPGRHGIGHNIYTYHHNPDGQIIELFTELDQMNDESLGYFEPRPWHTERPLKPKTWPKGPGSANLWGIMPPDWFLD